VGLRQAGNLLLTPRPHFTAPSCTLVNQVVAASDGPPFRQESRPTRICRIPWYWLVMRKAVLHKVTRFAECQAPLGVPPSTLSARLTQLTVAGQLVQRPVPQGRKYCLTEAGRASLIVSAQ
jgi:hypothetical protein